MRRIAAAALAVGLMSATSALAQPNGNNNGQHHNTGAQPRVTAPRVVAHPGGPAFVRPQGRPNFVRPQGGPTGFTPQTRFVHPQAGPSVVTPQVGRFHGPTTPQGFVGRPNNAPRGFNPGGQRTRYSPQFFPRVFNPGARFHWNSGRWFGPQGFYYRRWVYGEFLPFGWFAPQWYINDYWDYQLPPPPYGYEWVRSGPDALLVSLSNGMIVETAYNIFY